MATAPQLKTTLAFNLAPGASVVLPHGLGDGAKALAPDIIFVPNEQLEVTASDATSVTLKNNALVPLSGNLLVETWHTIEREFGAKTNVDLPVKPYIVTSDAGDAAQIRNPMSPPEAWIREGIGGEGAESGSMSTLVSQNFPSIRMIRAGSIVGVRARLNATLTAGVVTATATINGVPTALVATINPIGDTAVVTAAPGDIPYAAGDLLGFDYAVSGQSIAPSGFTMEAWLEVYEQV